MTAEITPDEAVEINPFSLNYAARTGFLDLRPKAVMVDPKEFAVARSEEQENPEQPELSMAEPEPITVMVETIPEPETSELVDVTQDIFTEIMKDQEPPKATKTLTRPTPKSSTIPNVQS